MHKYILGALGLLVAAAPAVAQKKKVAVLRFNNVAVQQAVQAMGGSNQDVGTGIADLLIQKLVEDGKYSVVERAALEKVGNEQNLSQGQLSDPDAAAKIGRLLNVDFIIIGSVNQFGAETNQTTLGGGSNLSVKGFGIGGVSSTNSKAVVEITARMIDVSNEEVVAAATGKGESSHSGGVSLQGTSNSKAGGGTLDMTGSDFTSSLLGDATHKAVNQVGLQLDTKAASLPVHAVKIERDRGRCQRQHAHLERRQHRRREGGRRVGDQPRGAHGEGSRDGRRDQDGHREDRHGEGDRSGREFRDSHADAGHERPAEGRRHGGHALMSERSTHVFPRRTPSVSWEAIDRETALLRVSDREVVRVNAVGARLWELADGTRSLASIAHEITVEFDVTDERALADAKSFVAELWELGAIDLSERDVSP